MTTSSRPLALPVDEQGIPATLKTLPQWVVWRYVADGDDWDKPPLCARGGPASSTDPRTWATFEAAIAAYRAGGLDGIGFVLHTPPGTDGPGLVGLDLDDVRDPQTGEIEEAWRWILTDMRTYTEISPSGCGLRLFALGTLPPQGRKKGRFEVYNGLTLMGEPGGRYVTVTGQHLQGMPRTIEPRQQALDKVHAAFWPKRPPESQSNTPQPLPPRTASDAELLRLAFSAKGGEEMRQLWNGDITGYPSQSEADLALCNHLAFWVGPDEQRIAELFGQSGLARAKWQREDYRKATIARALAGRTDYYTEPGQSIGTIHLNGSGASNGTGKHKHYSRPEEIRPPPEKETGPILHTLPSLLAMELPEPVWVVPGILSEGLTLLAGKPKLGKSMMALALGMTVAAGGMALGSVKTTPGDVLYLSLEDRWRRLKFRAEKMLTRLGVAASSRLEIATTWPRQGDGAFDQIRKWMDRVACPRLIIVDVWQKFRPSLLAGNQYEQDYNHAAALKDVGDSAGCNLLALHHCKKAKADDVVDEISGTLGLAGAADGLVILSRNRSDMDAFLFVSGRDIEERKLSIRFDPDSFLWSYLGEAAEQTESSLKARVISIFKANSGSILSTGEIADSLGLQGEKREYLRMVLLRMNGEGLVEKIGVGRWRWPLRPAEVAAHHEA